MDESDSVRSREESACNHCLRRAWLLTRLASHITKARGERSVLAEILALPSHQLIAALGGKRAAALKEAMVAFDASQVRAEANQASLHTVCLHSDLYPSGLRDLPDPPAVLYVAGSFDRFLAMSRSPAVAVVGSRKASSYGLEIATRLGSQLAGAGVTVFSGMALGVDSAAHSGSLDRAGLTVAVLASGADTAYPASKRNLYRRIVEKGVVVSEFPPGFRPHKWCFPARNRIIAALVTTVVVVEGAERSGSLITAEIGQELGRTVGAVPGRVTSPLGAGPNALIYDGAHLIRNGQDILDLLFGVGAAPQIAAGSVFEGLAPHLKDVAVAVAEGHDSLAALIAKGREPEAVMAALAELELLGHICSSTGGRYVVAG